MVNILKILRTTFSELIHNRQGELPAAVRELDYAPLQEGHIRQIKYLNNIAEQDHRFIKKITRPMLGFKSYTSAHATLMGIELHHMLHKGQHTDSKNMPR